MIEGFVDADYADDQDRWRSTSGYVFTFTGCALRWKANLQSEVALSTTESEYIAIVEGVKEALWLKNLSEELGLDTQHFLINSDSQSAIHLSKNIRYHEKTKHISIRYHFLKVWFQRETLI